MPKKHSRNKEALSSNRWNQIWYQAPQDNRLEPNPTPSPTAHCVLPTSRYRLSRRRTFSVTLSLRQLHRIIKLQLPRKVFLAETDLTDYLFDQMIYSMIYAVIDEAVRKKPHQKNMILSLMKKSDGNYKNLKDHNEEELANNLEEAYDREHSYSLHTQKQSDTLTRLAQQVSEVPASRNSVPTSEQLESYFSISNLTNQLIYPAIILSDIPPESIRSKPRPSIHITRCNIAADAVAADVLLNLGGTSPNSTIQTATNDQFAATCLTNMRLSRKRKAGRFFDSNDLTTTPVGKYPSIKYPR